MPRAVIVAGLDRVALAGPTRGARRQVMPGFGRHAVSERVYALPQGFYGARGDAEVIVTRAAAGPEPHPLSER